MKSSTINLGKNTIFFNEAEKRISIRYIGGADSFGGTQKEANKLREQVEKKGYPACASGVSQLVKDVLEV